MPARGEEATADAERERRSRALEEPLEVSWTQTAPYGIALVRNPLHGTRYRAYLPGFPSADAALCTCPDFALRGLSTCKHLEAIRLWLADHPRPEVKRAADPARASTVWAAVDRARRGRAVGPLTGRSLRAEGRLLIDPPFPGRASRPAAPPPEK